MRERGQLPQQGNRPVEGRVNTRTAGFFDAEVYGKPAPQGSKVQGFGRSVREDNPNTKPWRERIARVCELDGYVPMDGPLEAECHFVFEPPKNWDGVSPPSTKATYDTDKLVRAAFDALTMAGVWVDDARCSKHTAERWYVGQDGCPLEEAGVALTVWTR